MNFYTLIFKPSTLQPKKWIRFLFLSTFLLFCIIFLTNLIVDPYNMTPYNILHLKYKFARDDRTEKVNYFKTLPRFDNILIGSSRVYSINPRTVSKILGGSTYNFGVGTATVEDHLGILKYLIRQNKIPKNIILGVDFYTFNPEIPPNSYFLRNKELNFLSYKNYDENLFAKFFSFDAFRASIKTLTHNLHHDVKPRFDALGWGGTYEDYSKRDLSQANIYAKKEILEEKSKIYSNFNYEHIDPKRIAYYEEIKELAKRYGINLYVFPTPLHPYLLKELKKHKTTRTALHEFITYLRTFPRFVNMFEEKALYSNLKNFNGATHTTSNAGDIMMKKLLTPRSDTYKTDQPHRQREASDSHR